MKVTKTVILITDDTSPLVSQREQLNRAGNLTQAASKILENKKRRRRHPRLGEVEVEDTTTTTAASSSTTTSATVVVTAEKEDVFDGELDSNSNYTGFLEVISKFIFRFKRRKKYYLFENI